MSPATALLLAALAASPRVAVLPLNPSEGVTPAIATAVGEALVAELRKLEAAELVTSAQISAVLGHERQKELMGCASESCLLEVAGALDVSQLVAGTLSRLGTSWLLQLQRLDAHTGAALAHASAREQGAIDALLDRLPHLARELFPAGATAAARPPVPAPMSAPAPALTPLPPAHAQVALASAPDRAALVLLTDGKGRYLAVKPFSGLEGPLLAGDEKALYLQRVFGAGSEGTTSFGMVFWEPRARVRAEASFDFREGRYTLTCGKQTVPLQVVPAARARKLLGTMKLYDVRWRRYAHALARDDEGRWYYVDHAREPDDSPDFHLYLGEPGALEGHLATALAQDRAGALFRAASGRLKLDRQGHKAQWLQGEAKVELTLLDPSDHARQLYGPLGPYAAQPLGTPCDGRF